jgi:hypothetical protein
VGGYPLWDVMSFDVSCIQPDAVARRAPQGTDVVTYIESITSPGPTEADTIWGRMGFADFASLLVIDISAYYVEETNSWKAKVDVATSSYWLWWRLLPPRPSINKPDSVFEATGDKASALNCEKMMTDLKSLGRYDADWYVLAAEESHESNTLKSGKLF